MVVRGRTCTVQTVYIYTSCSRVEGVKMAHESLKRSPLREGQQNNGPFPAGEVTLQRRNGAGCESNEPSSRKRYEVQAMPPNSSETFSDEGDSFLW